MCRAWRRRSARARCRAATTVLIRASNLARATAAKTLFYQLGVSAPLLIMQSSGGVMTADPRVVPDARLIERIGLTDLLRLTAC